MSDFVERVERGLRGIEAVSTGACPGCIECGLEDFPTMDCPEYQNAGESEFSRVSCDACGSSLAGDRHPAHGLLGGEVTHFGICTDCLFFLANGEEPEDWEG